MFVDSFELAPITSKAKAKEPTKSNFFKRVFENKMLVNSFRHHHLQKVKSRNKKIQNVVSYLEKFFVDDKEKHENNAENKEPTKKKFSCIRCEKQFDSLIEIRKHMFLHSSKGKVKCRFCDGRTSNKDKLHRHENSHVFINFYQKLKAEKEARRMEIEIFGNNRLNIFPSLTGL